MTSEMFPPAFGPAASGAQFGRFLATIVSADPTGETEGIPDGLTVWWVSGSDGRMSTYYASLGAWKTVSLT